MAISNYGLASVGISTISNIMGDLSATKAFKTKVNARANASIASMESAVTSFELEQMKMAEQINDLNHVLGDKLTERGLKAIQNQAMLKAAAAETGTAGGTTDIAIQEAFMTEHFDRANIIAESKNRQKNILASMDLGTVKLQNDLRALGSGMPIADTNPMLTALSGGLNVATESISMLPMSERVDLFSISPQDSLSTNPTDMQF